MTQNVINREPSVARVNDVNIVYDSFGNTSDPAILLIMGLGCQMIDWGEEFCSQLASHGYWTIRFDNRDVGLSTKLDDLGTPDIRAMLTARNDGQPVQSPYSLSQMSDDTVGLLDFTEIDSAHVIGLSMGGEIAQLMAIHHPKRLLSLTSIMSSTAEPVLPRPTPEASALLTDPAPPEREDYIEYRLAHRRVLCGPGFPFDEKFAREHAGRRFDRGLHPDGFARQLAAILASEGRKEALTSVTIPTLVIHGDRDPLVPVECGIDTADAIPGAELRIIEGMGHDWPPSLLLTLIDTIVDHISKAQIP